MVDWDIEARRILKAELTRRGVQYKVLVERLAKIGVIDTEKNVANKIARGKFAFSFFLQCMHVLGAKKIDLGIPGLEERAGRSERVQGAKGKDDEAGGTKVTAPVAPEKLGWPYSR